MLFISSYSRCLFVSLVFHVAYAVLFWSLVLDPYLHCSGFHFFGHGLVIVIIWTIFLITFWHSSEYTWFDPPLLIHFPSLLQTVRVVPVTNVNVS